MARKKRIDKYEIMEYAVVLLALALLVFVFIGGDLLNTQSSEKNLSDKCKTQSGYTDEQWKEHMGHHPDFYEECLK